MRIVLVEPDLADCGALRISLDRAQRWRQAGAEVELFLVQHGPANPYPVPEGLVLHRGTDRPERFRRTVLLGLWRLRRLAHHADVVVAGREVGLGLLFAAVAARSARRPFAVTVQSHPELALAEVGGATWRVLTRRAVLSTHLAVCVSAALVPVLEGLGLARSRTAVVTNGVDVEAVRRAASAPDVEVPPGTLVIACGRLTRQKGFDVLLRAHARALREGAPPHELVILGDGPDRAALGRLADALGVSGSVHFAGFVANPHAVVVRASLFVLSSRWEGYGLVVAEALCVGTPVIATDCVSGPREILDGGRFGRLVAVEDEAGLAAAMNAHLVDPAALRLRAAAAADAAADRFDATTAAQQHLHLLADLSKHSRRRRGSAPAGRSSGARSLQEHAHRSDDPRAGQAVEKRDGRDDQESGGSGLNAEDGHSGP